MKTDPFQRGFDRGNWMPRLPKDYVVSFPRNPMFLENARFEIRNVLGKVGVGASRTNDIPLHDGKGSIPRGLVLVREIQIKNKPTIGT